MDCRTAHAVMGDEQSREPDELQAYQEHLAGCAACRDDNADALARALLSISAAPAQPPDDFTSRLLARLPAESPLTLKRLASQRARRLYRNVGIVVTAIFAFALLLGALMAPALAGSALGLVDSAVRQIITQAALPLLVLLSAAVVVAWMLRLSSAQPTAPRVLGGAVVAVALLLVGVGAVVLSDRGAVATAGTTATLGQDIVVDGSHSGNVYSAWGDIIVGGDVQGDVASLGGNVQVESGAVQGDVFAGSGTSQSAPSGVAGTIYTGPQGLALSSVLVSTGVGTLSPEAARAVTALLGSLIVLALAALLVMLWPQLTLGASSMLPARPWLALGLGVMLTALLALLALPLLALLALTVIGVLLVPLLLLLVHLPYIQGLAVVGQALGQRLAGAVTTSSAVWGVAAQLVLVIGLALVSPAAALLAFYLLGSLGLGAWMLWRRQTI